MRSVFVPAAALLATLLCVACGGNSAAAGTYVIDADAVKKQLLDDAGSPEERKSVEQITDLMVSKMRFELTLTGDGRFTASGGMGEAASASGTYTISGKKLTLVTTEEQGKQKAPPGEQTGTIADGVITLTAKGRELTLRKR
jgi:hypothetical protein